jgi:hypothetical protein
MDAGALRVPHFQLLWGLLTLVRYLQRYVRHTFERDAVLDTSPWVEVLRMDEERLGSEMMTQIDIVSRLKRTSAFPRISTPNALLSELIRTSGVFPWGRSVGQFRGGRSGAVLDAYQSTPSLHPVPRHSVIRWGVGYLSPPRRDPCVSCTQRRQR